MVEQTTQLSSSDEITNRLIAIENRLNAIDNNQRVRSQRLYWFDAGLVLMVAGLTIVVTSIQATYWWGIIIFVIGLLLHRFVSRFVK